MSAGSRIARAKPPHSASSATNSWYSARRSTAVRAPAGALQHNSSGATMTMPVASPSHQVSQCMPKSAHGTWPASASVVTPQVAATIEAPKAMAAKRHTAAGCSKRCSSAMKCRISIPASAASAALPAPIARATGSVVPLTPRLASSAPSRIPGQMRPP